MDLKEKICAAVDRLAPELVELSHKIHDNPELGLQEHQAVAWQKELLTRHGFSFESPFCGMDTAYRAVKGTVGKGPQLGILAEYDALKGIGHGCGHNVICASSCGAAIALAGALEGQEAAVFLFGTPAEETFGGKIPMADAGAFDDLDCAMMMHPSPNSAVTGGTTLAYTDIYVEFHGKPGHSSRPGDAVNALTSTIALFNAVNAQLHLWPNKSKINGVIVSGGTAPNIIPGFSRCEFCMRAEKLSQVKSMYADFERLVKAAAAMTGATYTLDHSPFGAEQYMNRPLDEAFVANMASLGETVEFADPNAMTGSSDVGNVSLRTPAIQPHLSLQAPGVNGHTPELCAAAASPRADALILLGAKGLAMTCADVFTSPELRHAMREHYEKTALPNKC